MMTPLREHLQDARKVYESASYPGDLAADLLADTRSRRWRMLPALLAGAIAASILVVVSFGPNGGAVHPISSSPTDGQLAMTPRPSPSYEFPDRVPLTLPASPLLPAMPVNVSFTDLNHLGQQQYEQLAPRLRQLWSGWGGPKADHSDTPTTQQAV